MGWGKSYVTHPHKERKTRRDRYKVVVVAAATLCKTTVATTTDRINRYPDFHSATDTGV